MQVGDAVAITIAFFTGKLRQRFFADVREFGDDVDAPRIVAAGYVCLAASLGLITGFFIVLSVNPAHCAAHVLQLANAAGCIWGFAQIGRRRDPRPVIAWLVLFFLASVTAMSFANAGIIPPITWTLPALAAVVALFLRGVMRRAAIALGVGVGLFIALTASGIIGYATAYTSEARSVLSFATLAFSTICLGGIAWVANLSRDYAIEQLAKANAEIVESAARSRIALEAARVGLWDVPDAELRKFNATESFQSITGYAAEEFDEVFTALDRFVHADDIVAVREAFALGRKRMSRLRVDFRLMTKARGYRWFSARAKYSQNPDGSMRISGSLQDINFIKAAEEALRAGRDRAREANQAKSDFIAMMSHEVRTPLNAILGSVEVLKGHRLAPETGELVELIDDAGRGLLAIVNDLLDVSKIEAGKLEIAPAATVLPDVVTRLVDVWRAEASAKGLRLDADVSQAAAHPVLVDAGRLRQIVGNLVSNAIKFTDEGSVKVVLAMREIAAGAVDISITVADTGPGVAPAISETIFAPFEQGPNGRPRGGAGLGLFISRRLARLMGGELSLLTGEGKGASFRLQLTAPGASAAQDAPAAPDDAPAWAGRRILCVDDNAANRRIAELLLSQFGVQVTQAASGGEAIDLCGVEMFDVILMDIVMPDMDGVETLARLRSDPSGFNQQTPAIALTAKLSSDDLAAYAAAGFDGVASKPIQVVELASAIAPFLVRDATVQELRKA